MPKVHTYSRVTKNKKSKNYLPHIIIVLIALVLTIPLLKSQNLLSFLRQAQNSNAATTFTASVNISEPTSSQVISPAIWGVNFHSQNVFNKGEQYFKTADQFFTTIPKTTYAQLGIKAIRYPGGCVADSYNPATGIVNYAYGGKGMTEQTMPIPELIKMADVAGAEIIFQINIEKLQRTNPCGMTSYYEGTISSAQSLLQQYGSRIKYFEIGNEQVLTDWSASEYATSARAYSKALKAINSGIKIGVQGYQQSANQADPKKADWENMLNSILSDTCGTVACFDFVTDHSYVSSSYSKVAAEPDVTKILGEFYHDTNRKKTWARNCPVSDSRGLISSACGNWYLAPVTPDEENYRSLDAYKSTIAGKEHIIYSIIRNDGRSGMSIDCVVQPTFIDCGNGQWSAPFDLTNTRGVGNESYADAAGYSYTVNGKQVFDQAIISMDGRQGWSRSCPVDDNTGVIWSQCGEYIGSPKPWSNVIDLTNIRGVGNESYIDQKGFVITIGSTQTFYQSITESSGAVSWSRSCPINNSVGITWSNCSGWARNDLSVMRGVGGERYNSSASTVVTITPYAMRQNQTNFQGMSAFFPQSELSNTLSLWKTKYKDAKNKDIAMTEWSSSGNPLQVNTQDTVEQGMFVAESLIEYSKKNMLMANFHPGTFNGGDLGKDFNKLNPAADAFKLTSNLANGVMVNTQVSSPVKNVPGDSKCLWPCIRNAVNVPYVNSIAAYSSDKSKLYVLLTNKHESEDASITVNTSTLPKTSQSSISIEKLVGGSYLNSDFSNIKETVAASDNFVINLPHTSVALLTLPLGSRNKDSVGNVDVIAASGPSARVAGWAYDPDLSSANLKINVYIDGDYNQQLIANILRTDVNTAFGISGNHGFDQLIYMPTGTHSISLGMVDSTSGKEIPIPGSPKSVTIAENVPPTGSLNIVTSPTYNTINVQGTASDSNITTPAVVKIYDNGVLADTTSGVVFNRTLTGRTAGTHTIKVVALDDRTSLEYEITGSPKTVTVSNPPVTPVPQPVTGLQAVCNTTGTLAQVSWNTSAAATSYLLRADRQTDGWSGVCPLNTPNGGDQCTSNITATNFALTTNPNTPYNVWVHASNSAGNSSPVNIAVNCSVNRLPVGVLNSVTSPSANSIQVQATANDPDTANPIVLKIYDNSVLAQTVTTLNLNTTLTNRTAGVHTIKVTATDSQTGQEVELTGSPKTVTVQNPATIAPTPTIVPTIVPTPTSIPTTTNFTVLAAGGATPGLELPIFELRYKDVIVGSPTRTTSYMATYNFNVPTSATIGDFKVVYTNDYSSSANGTYVDRDLRVDSVTFKGVTYRSDAAATYSTGTWTSSTGCAPGYKSSVWLHCNGYFQYASTPIGPVDPVRIEAESYTQTTGDNISGFNGVENKGTYISRFDLGDTVSYSPVNLSGKTSATFNYISRLHPGYIEIHQDSVSGPIIGKIYTGQTLYSAFNQQTISLSSGLSGTHTIHLVARDAYGVADIDWFEFK